MSFWNTDPGPCPICDAPHCACVGDGESLTIVQTPARDAALARERAIEQATVRGPFNTGTYRREQPSRAIADGRATIATDTQTVSADRAHGGSRRPAPDLARGPVHGANDDDARSPTAIDTGVPERPRPRIDRSSPAPRVVRTTPTK